MIAFNESGAALFRPSRNSSPNSSSFVCARRSFRACIRHRASFAVRMSRAENSESDGLTVMVNGLPGKMATAVAEEVLRRGLALADESLTGLESETNLLVEQSTVALSPPSHHNASLERSRQRYPRLVVVDYTHPNAVNTNVQRYAAAGLSFVVGTTGGNASDMENAVRASEGVYAVIAPNMGKQIVAFQAMLEMAANQFPGAFHGYKMTVKESHQATKADTSGTAKAVVASFNKLGLDYDVDQIEKNRDADRSINDMNVPAEHVESGHAYHTYHLTSPDGSVNFEFQHNVCGRAVYAAGTVDAVLFLDSQRQSNSAKRLFSMIDILGQDEMS